MKNKLDTRNVIINIDSIDIFREGKNGDDNSIIDHLSDLSAKGLLVLKEELVNNEAVLQLKVPLSDEAISRLLTKPDNEKRKLQRRNFLLDMEVIDINGIDEDGNKGIVLGDLADITIEGIMLISEQPVDNNATYQLRVNLPEDVIGTEKAINFEAQSFNCHKTIHENIYTTGFKMTKLDGENKQRIREIISEYAI